MTCWAWLLQALASELSTSPCHASPHISARFHAPPRVSTHLRAAPHVSPQSYASPHSSTRPRASPRIPTHLRAPPHTSAHIQTLPMAVMMMISRLLVVSGGGPVPKTTRQHSRIYVLHLFVFLRPCSHTPTDFQSAGLKCLAESHRKFPQSPVPVFSRISRIR